MLSGFGSPHAAMRRSLIFQALYLSVSLSLEQAKWPGVWPALGKTQIADILGYCDAVDRRRGVGDDCAGRGMHHVRFLDRSRVRACGLHDDGTESSFWVWAIQHRRWEPCTFRIFERYINTRTSVLDFGAWVGPLTLYSGTRARRVVGLEPNPTNFCELARNIRLNVAPRRAPPLPLEVVHGCVSNTTEEQVLNLMEAAMSFFSSRGQSQVPRSGQQFSITCFSLKETIERLALEPPLFIKIDTEGWEQVILPSIGDVVAKWKPTLFISMHLFLRTPSLMELKGMAEIFNMFPLRYSIDSNKSECHRGIDVPSRMSSQKVSVNDFCRTCDYLLTFVQPWAS